jgi:hypothetical protein
VILVRETPVVVIAYNRPDKVLRLIESLALSRPKHVIFAVDGPRANRPGDAERVAEVHKLVEKFTWTNHVETRFRPHNLGLRDAVVDAVSHGISKFGQAVILEEDTIPGTSWLPYAQHALDTFRGTSRIEHISGYNLVPPAELSRNNQGSRLTRYPESIAWATWDRAWDKFDGSLDWAHNVSVRELATIVGSRAGALRWKQNFADAEAGRISTWAYRWIASMWSRNAYVLSPNQNLVTYGGYDEGTNSFLSAPWTELPVFQGPAESLFDAAPEVDTRADQWVGRSVFAESPFGVARGVAISAALAARKRYRDLKTRGR